MTDASSLVPRKHGTAGHSSHPPYNMFSQQRGDCLLLLLLLSAACRWRDREQGCSDMASATHGHFSLLRFKLFNAMRCSSEQNFASSRRRLPIPVSNHSPQCAQV
jgi:hypothetical protein